MNKIKNLFAKMKDQFKKMTKKISNKKVQKKILNKKFFIIFFSVITLIVVLVISLVLINNMTNEKKLKTTLENYGRSWYEDYYYLSTGENDEAKTKYLSNFNNVGIKISLDNILRYEKTLKHYKEVTWTNNKTNEACNADTTMVTIYPQEPYGVSDYQISIYLDCGFTSTNK